ncbi:hypothetical protein [Chryseobacterium sp. 22543]|uniref:hypothetical protein n=1 Tax=Chryseobacterium sp. 22543 TaxID=3453940 RepID=UPI003F826573
MIDKQLLSLLRSVSIEEAADFQVPPALIDVILVKQVFKSSKRCLVEDYLQSGALFRFLKNTYGPFAVLTDLDQPTVCFSNGSYIGSEFCDIRVRICRWDGLIYRCVHGMVPGFRDKLTKVLSERILSILEPCYA